MKSLQGVDGKRNTVHPEIRIHRADAQKLREKTRERGMMLFSITRDDKLRNDLLREKENNEDFCRRWPAKSDHPPRHGTRVPGARGRQAASSLASAG